LALVHYDELKDSDVRKQVQDLCKGYKDKSQYFVDHLSRGIGKTSASQYPAEVIVRLSDFKTNEYANLIGGGLSSSQKKAIPCLVFAVQAGITVNNIAKDLHWNAGQLRPPVKNRLEKYSGNGSFLQNS